MKRKSLSMVACAALILVSCGRSDLSANRDAGWSFGTDAAGPDLDAGQFPDLSDSSDTGGVLDLGDDAGPDSGCVAADFERCGNGIDDDCDGVVDEACACNFGDVEIGVCANGRVSRADGACEAPDFYEPDEQECDGRDNDCDGGTDEGCTCTAGETLDCYNGPEETRGVGPCVMGALVCTDDFFGGDCVGEVTPVDEACNGIDDDCDGTVDEGCSCAYGGTDLGVCGQATLDETGNCAAPAAFQVSEVACDGLDNDCDGVADAGCTCAFNDVQTGVCAGAVVGADGACAAPSAYEVTETTCDGKDNDCDGVTDPDCACRAGESVDCYDGADGTAGVGVCKAGLLSCVDGMLAGGCEGQVTPVAELCNGADDDCDGVVDESCACEFGGTAVGVCAMGFVDAQGACAPPTTYQAVEDACDGLDNDCDGVADVGCPCGYNGTTRGVCGGGVVAPDGTCTPPANFEAEETTCDGVNNDCDGGTDEGCPCVFRGGTEGVCADAVRNSGGQCRPPRGYTGGNESKCNDGLDNDCNGLVDCDDANCAGRAGCP